MRQIAILLNANYSGIVMKLFFQKANSLALVSLLLITPGSQSVQITVYHSKHYEKIEGPVVLKGNSMPIPPGEPLNCSYLEMSNLVEDYPHKNCLINNKIPCDNLTDLENKISSKDNISMDVKNEGTDNIDDVISPTFTCKNGDNAGTELGIKSSNTNTTEHKLTPATKCVVNFLNSNEGTLDFLNFRPTNADQLVKDGVEEIIDIQGVCDVMSLRVKIEGLTQLEDTSAFLLEPGDDVAVTFTLDGTPLKDKEYQPLRVPSTMTAKLKAVKPPFQITAERKNVSLTVTFSVD